MKWGEGRLRGIEIKRRRDDNDISKEELLKKKNKKQKEEREREEKVGDGGGLEYRLTNTVPASNKSANSSTLPSRLFVQRLAVSPNSESFIREMASLSEVTFMIPITGPKVSSRMMPRVSYRECPRQQETKSKRV